MLTKEDVLKRYPFLSEAKAEEIAMAISCYYPQLKPQEEPYWEWTCPYCGMVLPNSVTHCDCAELEECDFCGWFDGKHSPTCKVNWGQVPKCYEL